LISQFIDCLLASVLGKKAQRNILQGVGW
jgi:hypothetical protein